MKKLRLAFSLFNILFSDPKALLKNLYHFTHNHSMKLRVLSVYGLKNGLPMLSLSDLFPSFYGKVTKYTYLEGTSKAIDIALLMELAKKFEQCEYLEIGSYRGESLINVAAVSKHAVSVSLSDEEMKQRGHDLHISIQRLFSKHLTNVTHIGHDSRTFDFHSLNKKFDLIFIDGDHEYEGVVNDTKKAFELLRDENSIIVWHDYGNSYKATGWAVLAGILDGSPKNTHQHIYSVLNTACAIFMKNAPKTVNFREYEKPVNVFQVEISGEKFIG